MKQQVLAVRLKVRGELTVRHNNLREMRVSNKRVPFIIMINAGHKSMMETHRIILGVCDTVKEDANKKIYQLCVSGRAAEYVHKHNRNQCESMVRFDEGLCYKII